MKKMDQPVEGDDSWKGLKLNPELQILNFGPWSMITRRTLDFDPCDQKPCLSMMVFLNEKSQLYILHVLNRSFKEGHIEGLEQISDIIQDFFVDRHPCQNYYKNSNSVKQSSDEFKCRILIDMTKTVCESCTEVFDEVSLNNDVDLPDIGPEVLASLKTTTKLSSPEDSLFKGEISEPNNVELSLIPEILESTPLFQDPLDDVRIDNNSLIVKNNDDLPKKHFNNSKASSRRSAQKKFEREGYRQVQCLRCDEKLRGIKTLRYHLKTVHALSPEDITLLTGKYQCSICQKDFITESRKERHKKRVHLAGDWHCSLCSKTARFWDAMKKHYESKHYPEQSKINCPTCKEELCFKDGIEMVSIHWRLCLAREKSKRVKLRTSNNDKHMCEECGKVFSCKKTLREHQEKHRGIFRHSCQDCSFKTTTLELLKSHWSNMHCPTAKKFQEKNYVPCQICGKILVDTYLQLHIDNVHSDPAWPCDQCDKGFGSKAILLKHKESKHFLKTVKCSECGMYVKSVSLWGHMKRHAPPKYCCKFCGKGLKTKLSLANHERLHTGENPYK